MYVGNDGRYRTKTILYHPPFASPLATRRRDRVFLVTRDSGYDSTLGHARLFSGLRGPRQWSSKQNTTRLRTSSSGVQRYTNLAFLKTIIYLKRSTSCRRLLQLRSC